MATLSGKWMWDTSPSIGTGTGATYASVSFTSNGRSFSNIVVTNDGMGGVIVYDDTTVYEHSSGWSSSGYRTVDFGSGVSVDSDFYDLFTTYASPVANRYTIYYYIRQEYNQNGQLALTMQEPWATQTYEEGETITPPAFPSAPGYTPTNWEY